MVCWKKFGLRLRLRRRRERERIRKIKLAELVRQLTTLALLAADAVAIAWILNSETQTTRHRYYFAYGQRPDSHSVYQHHFPGG